MKSACGCILLCLLAGAALLCAQPVSDEFAAPGGGSVTVTPLRHASLMLRHEGKVIYVDPVGQIRDPLPADLILVTHTHGDHLDAQLIARLSKPGTVVIAPAAARSALPQARILANGENLQVGAWNIEAVPAYNLKRERSPGNPYHPKGEGNGYVLSIAGLRFYFAGDTEATPEMKALRNIDVAFIPMNLPFTMTPEEAAEGVKAFAPRVAYPYHYRGADLAIFQKALQGTRTEVRIRDWYGQ